MEVTAALRRNGFVFLKQHFYLPIPDEVDMSFARRSELRGIAMDDDAQLSFTENVIMKYRGEFDHFPIEPTVDPRQYHVLNGSFMAGDGHAFYAIMRHFRPKTLIEIGCGHSSRLARQAIDANVQEGLSRTRHILVEPYSPPLLKDLDGVELLSCRVQALELDRFDVLEENDILFIDSSHALKSGGDVWYEYCEILPRLKRGVLVHVHDISLPNPYPRTYFDQQLFWNEQYVLQAYLTYNSKVEVLWAGAYLYSKYRAVMDEFFSPGIQIIKARYPNSEPTSVWMRIIQGGNS